MQLFSRNKAFAAVSLGALAALGACGDDVTVPVAPAAPVVISISPPSATMNVGERLTFAVSIGGGSATAAPTLASCTSSNTAVITAAVAGSTCSVTAVAPGNATVTAAASTGQAAAAGVSVVAPPAAISGLAISPSASQLAVGGSVTLVPTVNRAGSAVNVAYTYTSSSTATATVTSAGVVTAVAPGTATITVTAAGTGTGFSAATLTTAATITVSERAAGLTALQVSPSTATLAVGGTQQVTATAQGPRASAATITYGTSAPSIATVSSTGVITAVAAGTATITVTAQSEQSGAFAAASITGLVTVTVTPPAAPANVTIQAINQGPIVTLYSTGALTGIASLANPQVNQPIDITNVRDQIQIVANLQPNGGRVDSVVAFIANADGTGRRAAARQLYSNGTANEGTITLYVNTADFTANFTTGVADVFYANGQKVISVSVFGPNGETQNAQNNRQTVNFNNVDGYAAQYTNPTNTARNPDNGLNWWGGPGAAGQGSASIVPVFYTAGRSIASLQLGMLQVVGSTVTQICDQTGQTTATRTGAGVSIESYTAAPFRVTYNGDIGRMVASSASTASNFSTAGNGNIECRGYEHPAVAMANVIGVIGALDNSNTAAPLVSYAGGYRASAAVPAPVANRLDYLAPATVEPDIRRAAPGTSSWTTPAVTGWVNATFSMAAITAASTDNGVGTAGTRSWFFRGCAAGNTGGADSLSVAFDGTGNTIPECATNALGGWNSAATTGLSATYGFATRGPYRAYYSEADRLGNLIESVSSQPFGVDKTPPSIRWTASSSADTTVGAFTFAHEVIDTRAGFIDDALDNGTPMRTSAGAAATLATASFGSQQYFISRGAQALIATAGRAVACTNLSGAAQLVAGSSTSYQNPGAAFNSAPSCAWNTLPASAIGGTLGDGWRTSQVFTPGASNNGIYHVATRVFDRAGNPTDVQARRAARDASNSLTVSDLNVPQTIDRNTNPTFPTVANDNVEIRANNVSVSYGAAISASRRLVYPAVLQDGRFTDVINAPVTRDVSVPLGTPFVVSVQRMATWTAASSTTGTTIQDINARMFDIEDNTATSPTISFGSTTFNTQTGFGNTTGLYTQWAVLPSTAAGWNAPEGLKAQLRSSTNVSNSPFSRVDFYRLTGGEYQYLGSQTTPASADQGTERNWTYTLPNSAFANTPTSISTQQAGIQIGDAVIAIGVRSNGAGLVTDDAVIGGNAINLTIAGLPAGGAGSVTITDGAGFTTTATSSGIVVLPAAGNYFVTGNAVVVNSTSYAPTAGTQTIAVSGLASATVTYAISATRIAVTTAGLATSATGQYTIGSGVGTFTDANGTRTINVPAAGSYSVTAASPQTIGSFVYTTAVTVSPVVVVAGPAAQTTTVNYTNTTERIAVAVVAPVGVTPNVTYTCAANAQTGSITTTGTSTFVVGNPNAAAPIATAGATCAITAANVTAGGLTYVPTGTGNANVSTSTGTITPNITVTYAVAQPTITVDLASIGGAPNNIPNGIAYTVRVTSSAYSATGGFIDVNGVSGTPLVINAPANGTYNVSINRVLTLGTQIWRINASADVTTAGGATTGTVSAGLVAGDFALTPNPRPNANVSNIVLAGGALATDYQATVTFGFTGPLP